MWEDTINIKQIHEIRGKTHLFFGIGAIEKIDLICEKLINKGIDKVLVITGKSSYKTCGAWDYVEKALSKNEIQYEHYDKITPNPNVDDIDEASQIGIQFEAKAVLAIGGGSPIDSAKAISVLIDHPTQTARDLFEGTFTPTSSLPIVAINLTHGTGTEVDRFAVATIPEKNFKMSIACDLTYPLYSIDDPAMMIDLPREQVIYVSLDAINHALETATSSVASPYSIILAKEAIRLIAKYLPVSLNNKNDLTAKYYLAYAAMIAGTAFDNSYLHITHGLSHSLCALKSDLAHGLALIILLPIVLKKIYPAKSKLLAEILNPIIPDLKGDASEADIASTEIKNWISSFGVDINIKNNGFSESDIDKMVSLIFSKPNGTGFYRLAPIEMNEKIIRSIYTETFELV